MLPSKDLHRDGAAVAAGEQPKDARGFVALAVAGVVELGQRAHRAFDSVEVMSQSTGALSLR